MYEQLDIFSFLQPQAEPTKPNVRMLNVDYIGRLVLGEIEKGKIIKVEGNDKYFFYRTDKGCFEADDRTDFEQMEREAAEIRKQYKTIDIEADRFDKFFAVAYPPPNCDGKVSYAMVGIYKDMLFWQEDCTYQFLEPVKNLDKAYKEKVHKITHEGRGEQKEYTVLDKPIPTHRLYWSRHGFYADANYVKFNG